MTTQHKPLPVIPAKAGIVSFSWDRLREKERETPAFAGVTDVCHGSPDRKNDGRPADAARHFPSSAALRDRRRPSRIRSAASRISRAPSRMPCGAFAHAVGRLEQLLVGDGVAAGALAGDHLLAIGAVAEARRPAPPCAGRRCSMPAAPRAMPAAPCAIETAIARGARPGGALRLADGHRRSAAPALDLRLRGAHRPARGPGPAAWAIARRTSRRTRSRSSRAHPAQLGPGLAQRFLDLALDLLRIDRGQRRRRRSAGSAAAPRPAPALTSAETSGMSSSASGAGGAGGAGAARARGATGACGAAGACGRRRGAAGAWRAPGPAASRRPARRCRRTGSRRSRSRPSPRPLARRSRIARTRRPSALLLGRDRVGRDQRGR